MSRKTKIMYKKPPSMKLSSSMNNLMFLLLLGFSIFIMYRYVKSLENELKIVKTDIVSLKSEHKQKDISSNVAAPPPVCSFHQSVDETKQEEMESVTSEEILKIVEEIDDEENKENPTEMDVIAQEEKESDEDLVCNEEQVNDIVVTKSTSSLENDLYKKTNDELKKILKEEGKNTKGTKAELIKRIIEDV